MKKFLLLVFYLFAFFVSQGQLAVWDFTGDILSASSSDLNVTAADITHVGLFPVTNFSDCNGDAWAPGSWSNGIRINDNYAIFTITAGASCTMTITGFTFSASRSITGPSNYQVRSSADSYGSVLSSGTIETSGCTTKGGNFLPIVVSSGSITFRIYGIGAASSGGNMIMDDVTIDGTILCATPVELTSFIATNNQKKVSLSWTTASELNNSHFDIEYSIDGANFRAIDEVVGNGTTQEKQEYSYTHTTPAIGTNYYRLKQVDYDGVFEYSDIRVVEIERTGKITILPSAAIAEITVQLVELAGENNQIGIYDMIGRTIMMSNFDGTLNTKTIDISKLQKGYYVVRVQAGSEVFTERFMKMMVD